MELRHSPHHGSLHEPENSRPPAPGLFARRVLASLSALLLASACTETNTAPLLTEPELVQEPGELQCFDPQPSQVKVRFEPRRLVMAPGQRKTVTVVVDPDMCKPTTVRFRAESSDVSSVPEANFVEYRKPSFDVQITAREVGENVITVRVPTGKEGEVAEATLDIDVLDPVLPSCDAEDDVAATPLAGGDEVRGGGTLVAASVAMPEGADAPNSGSFLWSVDPFEASIQCAEDAVPAGYVALGPAVSFGPADKKFRRDMPLSIPLNPARMPEAARLRHLQVAYTGPAHREPRVVTVADPLLVKEDGVWQLTFRATRLGTYQAVVRPLAGSTKRARRITHRAVIGVSMGGAGAMHLGLRHHHLFDVVGAMGGPVDWTWLINHVERNHLGGFRPIAPGTELEDIALERELCADDSDCRPDETCLFDQTVYADGATADSGKCTFLPVPDEPYEHSSTFNTWWFEFPAPVPGHGGDFDRRDHTYMFRDLALMFGNPFGYNPNAIYLPAGADPEHPAYKGNREGDECKIYVDPYDAPNKDDLDELWNSCPAERCATPQVLKNYYDDEFNPDGTFDVISFCDGAPKIKENTPYANWWVPGDNNNVPVEAGLAVDYNGNGIRDEMEPVIRAGHELWGDWGTDGTPSESEPGYGPDNLDPSGDDYDPRYNPLGTEGNTRYEEGEPFADYGLDGVPGTADSPYDYGEGDGTFTPSPGLQRFWDYDSRGMVRGESDYLLSTPLDDAALSRVDFWTDGGTRDLFNFAVAAEHFMGSFVSRGRSAVTFRHPSLMPGLRPEEPDFFNPAHIVYEDLPGVINYRYGKDEPTERDIESGSGQHVGTVTEFANRLQSALYFIDARWPDAHRVLMEESVENPAPDAPACEVSGNCKIDFTSSFGRTGPVQITLPPGYAHAEQQHIRYPVIYLLHGYGMTPEDLGAAIIFLANWMNGNSDSQASRLGKAILVYADGRCRNEEGRPAECVKGNFFADSVREDGVKLDAWFLELVDYIDQNYRTMGEATIEWPE
jgi:hypothetical protein